MDFHRGLGELRALGAGLDIQTNASGWGPIAGTPLNAFDEVPYAHFDKKERCGRPADFTQSAYYSQRMSYREQRLRERGGGGVPEGNAEFTYRHDAVEDSTFQLVDTTKATNRNMGRGMGRKQWGPPGGRTSMANQGGRVFQGSASRANAGGRGMRPMDLQVAFGAGGRGGGAGGGRGASGRDGRGPGGRGGRGFGRRDRKLDRMSSVAVAADWVQLEEFDLQQLLKLQANPPQTEDLLWAGHLDQYDEAYDKVTVRTAKPLKRVDNRVFYAVTTAEDPVLEKFAAEEVGNVFATDAILSQLMAAPRSLYSWDIVIQKMGGIIYLDKRDNTIFDFLTVSETAHDAPVASEEFDEINFPEKLALEATMINQNYSQQVLSEPSEATRKTFEPNPFFFGDDDQGMEPASIAFRYRKFNLGSVQLVARCELHGWVNKLGKEQFVNVFALNEWDSRFSGGVNWRTKIEQQKSAVLATELKNNSCKLAKWTAQAILSGADQMKLGYVSRASNTSNSDHVILSSQVFKPKDFATQINLSLTNMWGILKMISELLMKDDKPDGKYVLMKDPNKASVRLYSVPPGTFEDAEDDEDDEDEAAPGQEEEG